MDRFEVAKREQVSDFEEPEAKRKRVWKGSPSCPCLAREPLNEDKHSEPPGFTRSLDALDSSGTGTMFDDDVSKRRVQVNV